MATSGIALGNVWRLDAGRHRFPRLLRQFRSQLRDVVADLFELFLAPGGDQVAREDLRGEQARPCDAEFKLGSRSFPALDVLQRGFDDQAVQ